jgi:uroporphyrinogen-III synthase
MTERVLIVTRPAGDADGLVNALDAAGIATLAAPMMEITFADDVAVPDTAYQAIVVTSANSARALGRINAQLGLEGVLTIAVGAASAEAALVAGQADVIASGGDVDALVDTVRERCPATGGAILYLSGVQTAGDLTGKLSSHGYDVRRVIAYEAVAAGQLPGAVVQVISGQNAAGVILYSPRTALIWCKLLVQHGLAEQGAHLIHYCLSDNVAAVVRKAYGDAGFVVTADAPNEPAMIDAIVARERSRQDLD